MLQLLEWNKDSKTVFFCFFPWCFYYISCLSSLASFPSLINALFPSVQKHLTLWLVWDRASLLWCNSCQQRVCFVAINSSDTKRMSLRLVRKYTNIKCQKAWSQTPVCMCIHVHRRCCTAAHTDQRMPEILFYDVVLISSARSGLSCTVYLCDLYITNFWHTWGFI